MTIQSLQKIISLEEELFAAEQAEREKAALWLKAESVEILRLHNEELLALEEKQEKHKKKFVVKANQEASARLRAASASALDVDGLTDELLAPYVVKILKIITGDVP